MIWQEDSPEDTKNISQKRCWQKYKLICKSSYFCPSLKKSSVQILLKKTPLNNDTKNVIMDRTHHHGKIECCPVWHIVTRRISRYHRQRLQIYLREKKKSKLYIKKILWAVNIMIRWNAAQFDTLWPEQNGQDIIDNIYKYICGRKKLKFYIKKILWAIFQRTFHMRYTACQFPMSPQSFLCYADQRIFIHTIQIIAAHIAIFRNNISY